MPGLASRRAPAVGRSTGPRRAPALLALGLALVALTACSARQAPPPAAGGQALVQATPSVGDEDVVGLRVYLRSGSGAQAHLVAVTREVPVADDLPRRALELLLAGPAPGDPPELRPPLPTTARVAAFAVQDNTAVVDLSPEAITGAGEVGGSPEHELLALAAVANTLTDFPEIDRVRLTVAGEGGVFWGGWGLPAVLTRDESVIGAPAEGETLPALSRFAAAEQRIGSADAAPVRVLAVRAADRLGFLRVVVELGDGSQDTPATGVPPTRAWIEGGRLLLEIGQVLEAPGDFAPGQRLVLEDLPFQAVEAQAGALPGPLRLAVLPSAGQPFWLHTLTSPTRVVLDVRK